ncbi:hypothetical protein N7468_003778 [Penicillium chermesinum]|uniref:Transglutaminase-like domain-containing protein n=1 Tax=Penicillium chermesinum TaxID=63820 RepID=A0A9W9P7B3_9EURO|nr:uncharacterized protein N7468_003778 [Penicillium chermesinum]KAJ5239159.1 hypothetical protein N7468_003778 [Penicillium chermesinum]
MATEEPQLGSIQQRIAALKQAQAGDAEPQFIRPVTERSKTANNPPSYQVSGSVLDGASIGNKPAEPTVRRPAPTIPSKPTPTPSPKPKAPPPLPTRRADRQPPPPPANPPSRPSLPARRPTEDSTRRPSVESITSDASYSTANTTVGSVGRGASTTSVNSIGNGRLKAPAWGAELPVLPPKRPKEDPIDIQPPSRSESKPSGGITSGLTSKLQSLRGKASSSSLSSNAPARPARPAFSTRPSQEDDLQSETPPPQPARPKLPTRPSQGDGRPSLPTRPSQQSISHDATPPAPVPRLPPRRPSGFGAPSNGTNGQSNDADNEAPPRLPARRLPPPPTAAELDGIRKSGFGDLKKPPSMPARPSSTPAQIEEQDGGPNGGPPPVPHGSRPDLAKLQATKPRSHAWMGASPPAASSGTECMGCRDFSAPDNRGAQYPRASLPTHDMGWLANELTAPFPSPTDKARAIFSWLHHNIHYDVVSFFNNNVKPSTPANTLATGLAVCEGYAGLFAALANKAGLEAIVIGGHGKGYGYTPLAPGQPVPPFSMGHAWNAVKIDGGEWKLIDACWGAGTVSGKGEPYKPGYNPSMFTMSNDEFGLKHFPQNKDHFFRDDGRYTISWEEYITTNPDMPTGLPPIKIYSDVDKHSIGRRTFEPASGKLSVYGTPSPVRFKFGLVCEHWTLAHHSRLKPALFLLMIHGIDGRKDDQLPFRHVPGSGPGGGGEFWYVDVPDAQMLGAPGQKVQLAVLTSFGDRKDCRGLTAEEYESKKGRIGMAWAYICEWELVR